MISFLVQVQQQNQTIESGIVNFIIYLYFLIYINLKVLGILILIIMFSLGLLECILKKCIFIVFFILANYRNVVAIYK